MESQNVSDQLRYSYVLKRKMTFSFGDDITVTGTVIRYDEQIVDLMDALTGTPCFYPVSSIVAISDPYF